MKKAVNRVISNCNFFRLRRAKLITSEMRQLPEYWCRYSQKFADRDTGSRLKNHNKGIPKASSNISFLEDCKPKNVWFEHAV